MNKWLVRIHAICLLGIGSPGQPNLQGAASLIDLTDRTQIEERRPLLIAHRGGVVGDKSPECSLAAIRLAAKAGYAMVELDIQRSRDGVPIVFHDRTLKQACGVEGAVADYSSPDLVEIHYTGSDQRIVSLDSALSLCRELHLGIMLDLKTGRSDKEFLRKIDEMIVGHKLTKATVSISGSPVVRQALGHVMFTPTKDQTIQFRNGGNVDLRGTFWFGLPNRLPSADVGRMQQSGALVFPAINTFRYPDDRHLELAHEDIERLVFAGVDGFQIDSVYSNMLKGATAKGTETLRILSYNIHMWQIGVGDLAKVIRAADADIVGLNEAWNEMRNEEIARELGYNIVYGGQAPVRDHPAKPHTVNGFYMPQVLLTKHKIIQSEVFNAMAAKEHERFDPEVPIYRGGTLAVLETAGGNRLAVFVLHLHPWGDGNNEKMTTMRLQEIKGIIGKLKRYRGLPTLVIGDFNTRSHLDVEGGWKVTRYMTDQGFRDLYRTLKPDPDADPGLTCGGGRIDFIFHSGHFAPVDCHILTSGVLESRGIEHSDHLAVFGTLKLRALK